MGRAGVNASRLVRLLSEQAAVQATGPAPSFAERLGRWLDWPDAIALAAVLNGPANSLESSPADKSSATRPGAAAAARAAAAELEHLRADLARSIAGDALFTTPRLGAPPAAAPDLAPPPEPGFQPYRRRYAEHQRLMTDRIAALRGQLRSVLARTSAPLRRLAELDTVMDEALGARERSLLSTVPALLEKRFDGWRQAQPVSPVGPAEPAPDAPPPAAWLASFTAELRSVLLAELDCRLQPLEGLVEALAQRDPTGAAGAARP